MQDLISVLLDRFFVQPVAAVQLRFKSSVALKMHSEGSGPGLEQRFVTRCFPLTAASASRFNPR
jgi:hypothetical protein